MSVGPLSSTPCSRSRPTPLLDHAGSMRTILDPGPYNANLIAVLLMLAGLTMGWAVVR